MFSPSHTAPFYYFRTKLYCNIPTGIALTEASNAVWIGNNRDLRQYLAPSHTANGSTAKCSAGPWQVVDTMMTPVAGKRLRLFSRETTTKCF